MLHVTALRITNQALSGVFTCPAHVSVGGCLVADLP